MPLYQHNTIDWYDWLKLTHFFLVCFFIHFRYVCQHFPIPLKIHLYCHQSRQYFRWNCSNTIAKQNRARLFVRSCFAWFHLRWCVCFLFHYIYELFELQVLQYSLSKVAYAFEKKKATFLLLRCIRTRTKNKPYQSCKICWRKKTSLKFNSWEKKKKQRENEIKCLLIITKHRCHICDEMNDFFYFMCLYLTDDSAAILA